MFIEEGTNEMMIHDPVNYFQYCEVVSFWNGAGTQILNTAERKKKHPHTFHNSISPISIRNDRESLREAVIFKHML